VTRRTRWIDSDSDVRVGLGLTGWAIATVVVLALVYLVGALAFGGASWVTAPWRGEVDARNRTVGNGAYRIAQYDHFYDLCGDIQAADDRYRTALDMKKSDPTNPTYIANVAATKNARAALIRSYNADSSKAGTAAQFKASDLPYSIDINQETISCSR
jgi:hypothetical protein